MRKILFAIIPVLLLLSCAKEADAPLKEEEPAGEEQVTPSVSYHSVTLSATKADDTKTAYADDRYFSWSDGDQISVLFHNGTTHKWYTFTADAGGSKKATFTCDEIEDGYEIGSSAGVEWAFYPASDGHVYNASDGKVKFHIPNVVDQTSRESANIPMAAHGDGTYNYSFQHIAGCFKFTFTDLGASRVRLRIRHSTTHKLSGAITLSESGGKIYWWASAASEGSDNQQISILKTVPGSKTVTFYVPWGCKEESMSGATIDLIDEDTGYYLLHNVAKSAFDADALLPKAERMVVLPSISVPGAGVPLVSKFGIDWSSVTAASAPYSGITLKAYAPDSDYLYLYAEVDKTSLWMADAIGRANQFTLYLGNEDGGTVAGSHLWNTAPNTYHWNGDIAWLTNNGLADYKNRKTDLVLDYNYNGLESKYVYEIKIDRRYPLGELGFLAGAHTANVGCLLYNNLAESGGSWSSYLHAPEASMLQVSLPGESVTPIPVPDSDPSLAGSYSSRTVYTESSSALVNPERGFYKNAGNFTKDSEPLSAAAVTAARVQGYSLMYIAFYLTGFESSAISDAFLANIRTSLSRFAGTGVKCILRFAYSNGHAESDRPWDASEYWIKYHIGQLESIIADYKKDILVVQAGLIGSWGEWYYTESFGGGGDYRYINGNESAHDIDFAARKAVVDKLLSAVPSDRQVALRTPQFKMGMYGNTPLSAETAHDGSAISRLAAHNDCFKASSTDSGTFENESGDRDFWKADSKYVLMGGETCKLDAACACDESLQDLEDYHWTYLNNGYNADVLNFWKSNDCYAEIMNRLGYRLVLMDTYYTLSGTTLNLALRINNRGFSAPQNPREAKLVFVPTAGASQTYSLGSDPRTWHSGINVVTVNDLSLPSEHGTLYMVLSDPDYPANPLYSIACANTSVFESATGYNKLLEL